MFSPLNRRDFVRNLSGAGALAVVGDLAFLQNLPPLSAAQVQVPHARVQLNRDIEPLVGLIEDTQRDQLLEAVARRIREGTNYQQLLAALMLAGVRGIQPRPVGFKFHAVLVVNSAHLATLAAEDRDRWLPLLWSLDNFKSSQERNAREGNWSMPAADEARLPAATQARRRFIEAMDNWDEEGADRAIVSFVRNAGAGEVIELFWRYGARDFRDIGHKAIYAANAWRTLQTIGWRHAEPIMRSLAYALLEHEAGNPAQRDAEPDRPWRENLRRAARIRGDWQNGRATPTAATEVLAALRAATFSEAADRVVTVLNSGACPQNVWDGLLLGAGELLMRQPGIVGLHCVTSVNALHFAYQASGNDETRRMMMLQAAAFLTMFRARMERARMADLRLDTLEPLEPDNRGPGAVEEIFADINRDRLRAARKTLAVLRSDRFEGAQALMTAARRLIFLKGNDSHDYKFSSAALEDFFHATPAWRDRFLASSLFHLKGSGDRDNDLIRRARAALT
jgi:hypothetical protein